jgi:hypothetical protein
MDSHVKSSLLLFVSGVLVEEALAGPYLLEGMLILPQVIQCALPELIGSLRTILMLGKRFPPQLQRWQQPCSLFVFANGAIQGPIVA